MSTTIDYFNMPMFNLKGRRLLNKVEKTKEVRFTSNGLFILSRIYRECSQLKYETAVVADNKTIIKHDNKVLVVTLSLGKYVHNNIDLLEDFAVCHFKSINIENIKRIIGSRKQYNLNDIAPITLEGEFTYLDIEKINTTDFSDLKECLPKYANDEKLRRRLLNWFKECGISEDDVMDYNEIQLIPMKSILHILDMSLKIYNDYLEYIDRDKFEEIDINFRLHISKNDKGELKVEKRVTDLINLILLTLVSYYKNEQKSLRVCEYCGDYFFGRKSKKCCSTRCKDLKNGKYIKRKEKRKGSDSVC